MEKHLIHKEKAIKYMKLADHILTMTYPIVKDPKLLKLVLKNLHSSMASLMTALIIFDTKEEPDADFKFLAAEIKPVLVKHGISQEYGSFMQELEDTLKKQRGADVEFIRKERFVFAGKDYKLDTLTQPQMKDYLIKGKLFLKQVAGVIG